MYQKNSLSADFFVSNFIDGIFLAEGADNLLRV